MAATFVLTSNTNSSALAVRNHVGPTTKFEFTVFYYGTFDSGTIKLQASPDNGTTWIDIPNSSSTTATCMNMEIRATQIRANLSGAGGSASVSVMII
jgi:hypothetical protein